MATITALARSAVELTDAVIVDAVEITIMTVMGPSLSLSAAGRAETQNGKESQI